MSNEYLNRIYAYWQREGNEEERKRFESDLKTDLKLKEAYDEYLIIQKITKRKEELDFKNEMKEWSKDSRRFSFNSYWKLAVLVGALLIIFLSTIVKLSSIDRESLGKQFAVYEPVMNLRSETIEQDSLVQVDYFDPLSQAQKYMEEGKYKLMRESLEEIKYPGKIPSDNKEWMLALSYYMENGRNDESFKTILNKILDETNHTNYNQAVDLDSKVNSLWGRLKG